MANAGIREMPRSSFVTPLIGPPGVGAVEYNTGEEKNKPALTEITFVSNADMAAGFHCRAPLISIGCAVAAPPIDILVAPIPCIIWPTCASKKKGNKPDPIVANNLFMMVVFKLL